MTYDDALLTRLTAGVRAALPRWGVDGAADLTLLTISENATYLVRDRGRRLIVRVHRPNYHTEVEIASELAWIEALREAGTVATPGAVPTVEGGRIVTFDDGAERRHVVAFEHVAGREPDAESDLPRWYKHLGSITGRLHAHARAWTRPPGFQRKTWVFDTILGPAAYWGDWRQADGLDVAGRAVLEAAHGRLKAETAAYGQHPDRFGLVHCDMRTANLLVEGDRMAVIDFDDCGLSWFAYDFAASISFMEHEPIVPRLMAAWCEGYRSVAPFPEEQARALPMFVMLRRMQLLAWIASHAETPTARAMGPTFTRGTVDLATAYLGASAGVAA
ncbi:MAG: phosphotransferase [Methylorubrum populi]